MTAKLNANATGNVLVATSKASFVSSIERYALADPSLAVTDEDWNQQPWLLATPGGTIDLLTGELSPAERSNLISCLTELAPTVTSDCPRWLAFLEQATAQDQEVIAFVQRWLSYCLAGLTRERALLFAYGPGGNGKGVVGRRGSSSSMRRCGRTTRCG